MARKITVEILGDSRSLEKAFAKSSKSANNFNKDMSKTGKKSAGVFRGFGKAVGFATGALGVAGLAGAARAAFTEMADAQKVTAQTEAVLRSTGEAAGVSAEQVSDLAEALMRKSGVDDEVIASGENLLLTFTNVQNKVGEGNDIFNQATETMLDMSVALGQDTKQSAIQLGKALNDPIKGVGALRRVGVAFTAAQQAQIKALVKSGETMKAQKIILAELRKEFGGSAEAAGKTLPGKLNILRESMLNLAGTIAEQLTPAITKVVDRLVSWVSKAENQKKVTDLATQAFNTLKTALNVLRTVFETLSRIVGGNVNAIKALVAAYALFKALQIAASVSRLAGSFGLLTARTTAATAATRTFSLAMVGKAGLVAGVGVAAFAVTSFILKLTGLDKKLESLGGKLFDFAAKLGLVNDPMEDFKGKLVPKPADMRFIENSIKKMMAAGLTRKQAIDKFVRQHPGVARRDVEVAAGAHRGAQITVNQHFQAPTTDRHREARYALHATRAVFDT